MKSATYLSATICLLIASFTFVGCASNCGSSGNGIFGTRILENQPVRSTVRSWFRGDSCDTCNAPAGQMAAPACDTCNGGMAPMNGLGFNSQAQPLYGAPTSNMANGGVQLGLPNQLTPQPGPVVGTGAGNLGVTSNPPNGF